MLSAVFCIIIDALHNKTDWGLTNERFDTDRFYGRRT